MPLNRARGRCRGAESRAHSPAARSDPAASARPSSRLDSAPAAGLSEPPPPRLRLLGALPRQRSLPEAGRARRLVGPEVRALSAGGTCPGPGAWDPAPRAPGFRLEQPPSLPPRRCVSSLLLATVTSGSLWRCRGRGSLGSGRSGGSSGGGGPAGGATAMVLLHVKRGDESQFLLQAPGSAELGALTGQVTRIYNARLKVQRVCSGAARKAGGGGGGQREDWGPGRESGLYG